MSSQLKNPPVVEFVLGVQFAPLEQLTSAHFGVFWKDHYSDWTPGDALPLPDQFENLDVPRWKTRQLSELRFVPPGGVGRLILEDPSKSRLVQFQGSRFHLNWKKTESVKPDFSTMIKDFRAALETLQSFCANHLLGAIEINQWEVTYVDRIRDNTLPLSPTQWSDPFPGFFSSFPDLSDSELELEFRNVQWSFKIPKVGRLHVTASPGTTEEGSEIDSLIMNWTARGPASNFDEAYTGLERGRDATVGLFFQSASKEYLERWRQ